MLFRSGRELSVDEEAQSSVPKDRMIVLSGRELQDRGDVVGLEIGIVRENLLAGSTGGEEIEDILHADAEAANTRTPPADIRTDRNPVDRAHTSIVPPPTLRRKQHRFRPSLPQLTGNTSSRTWRHRTRRDLLLIGGDYF